MMERKLAARVLEPGRSEITARGKQDDLDRTWKTISVYCLWIYRTHSRAEM